jgi:polyferredoxin
MTKIGRPPRLIGYDTQMNVERRLRGEAPVYRMLRPRTILYAALILAIGGLMSLNLAMRDDARLSVIHDRNPLTVRLADGSVRNAYTVRFANMSAEPKRFVLEMSGVEDAEVEIVGVEPDAEGRFVVEVGPDQTREARVLVTVRGARAPAGQVPVSFTSRDLDTETLVDAKDVFVWP